MQATKRYGFLIGLPAVALAVVAAFQEPTWPSVGQVVFWALLLVAAELLPVALGYSTSITMGFPVLLAAAILFDPLVAMSIAAIGNFDSREIRREIPLYRAVF